MNLESLPFSSADHKFQSVKTAPVNGLPKNGNPGRIFGHLSFKNSRLVNNIKTSYCNHIKENLISFHLNSIASWNSK